MLWSSSLGFKWGLKIRNAQTESHLCTVLCSSLKAAASVLQLPSKPGRDGVGYLQV